jgi:gas vesicle structural protein
MAVTAAGSAYLQRPGGGTLADVVDIILDKGLVIDAYVRVSLIGIEILTIDARIVIASVDTYLRFAEAVNRLDIQATDESQGLPELMDTVTSGGAKSKTQGAIEGVKEKLGIDDEEKEGEKEKEKEKERSRPRRRSGSSSSRSRKKDDE